MKPETDRGRGILSPADRAYLLGEAAMEHDQSKRNAEARIRQRITDAILDFPILIHHLKKKDRRQVFDRTLEDDGFMDGLTAMLSFVYVGMEGSGAEFSHALEPAVRKAEEAHAAKMLGQAVSVDVQFDVETTVQTAVDDVTAAIDAGKPVTPAELFSVMVGSDALDDVDEVTLQLSEDGEEGGLLKEDEFVAHVAEYLDADLRMLPYNRVKVVV
ncbi:hypothetical protein [Haladaptatus sp. AB643]|uniref:hypothetical protein n=1 Tax=Haladaptatus sp. AB643 TaxID=2934174 RepID=UPI00209BFA5A|nr:hypothetical protein [Haladaptatus sp. AB643]MCO8245605.1 hypothetical protein [Haladaptatus sp. AB643]